MRETRRYVPAIILIVGCGLLAQSRSQDAVPLVAPLDTVMKRLDGFEVVDQNISAEEQRVAGMTNYVARTYSQSGNVVFTTLVSYYDRQSQGKTIHSPRNCLPGAGWEIMSGTTTPVVINGTVHKVNRYVLKNGPMTALAYYWYQGRGRVTANEYVVKWNLLRDAAIRGHTEEALVRVVVPVVVGGKAVASGASASTEAFGKADAMALQVSSRLMREVSGVIPGGIRGS
jgi:EpsI family protein